MCQIDNSHNCVKTYLQRISAGTRRLAARIHAGTSGTVSRQACPWQKIAFGAAKREAQLLGEGSVAFVCVSNPSPAKHSTQTHTFTHTPEHTYTFCSSIHAHSSTQAVAASDEHVAPKRCLPPTAPVDFVDICVLFISGPKKRIVAREAAWQRGMAWERWQLCYDFSARSWRMVGWMPPVSPLLCHDRSARLSCLPLSLF